MPLRLTIWMYRTPYKQKFVCFARGVANELTHGDDGVVDLEVDPNAMVKLVTVAIQSAKQKGTCLKSTPSLIVTGFFFIAATSFSSCKFMWRCLPGGRVGDASSKERIVTLRHDAKGDQLGHKGD